MLREQQQINAGYLHISAKTGYKLDQILKMSISEYYAITAGIVYNNEKEAEARKTAQENAEVAARSKRK